MGDQNHQPITKKQQIYVASLLFFSLYGLITFSFGGCSSKKESLDQSKALSARKKPKLVLKKKINTECSINRCGWVL